MASNGTKNDTNQREVPVDETTSGWEPTVQDEINLALAQNGGFKRIREALKQRLDETGWSQDLREYCTALFRSGEATTYPEAHAIIMGRIQAGSAAANGTSNGVPAPDLSIPISAQEGGAEAVKKELRQIVKPKNQRQSAPDAHDPASNASDSSRDGSPLSDSDASTQPHFVADEAGASQAAQDTHNAARDVSNFLRGLALSIDSDATVQPDPGASQADADPTVPSSALEDNDMGVGSGNDATRAGTATSTTDSTGDRASESSAQAHPPPSISSSDQTVIASLESPSTTESTAVAPVRMASPPWNLHKEIEGSATVVDASNRRRDARLDPRIR